MGYTIFGVLIGVWLFAAIVKHIKATPEQRRAIELEAKWGTKNAAMICPHCQVKGFLGR